jgi:hypothetical protein
MALAMTWLPLPTSRVTDVTPLVWPFCWCVKKSMKQRILV